MLEIIMGNTKYRDRYYKAINEMNTLKYHNPLGQVASADYYHSDPANPDSTDKETVSFIYDPIGRLLHESTTQGDETRMMYDTYGRAWVTNAKNNNSQLQFVYNEAGDVRAVYTYSLDAQPTAEAQPYSRFVFT